MPIYGGLYCPYMGVFSAHIWGSLVPIYAYMGVFSAHIWGSLLPIYGGL